MDTDDSESSASAESTFFPRVSQPASPFAEGTVGHHPVDQPGEDGKNLSKDEDDSNDEEEEEENSSDVDSVVDPENITMELANIFTDAAEFHGSFYTSKSYPDAPNPCLNVDGLGSVALPLSTSTAISIIKLSSPALLEKEEICNTWEMNPSKIKFNNVAWSRWINKIVVPQVCEDLGIDYVAENTTLELFKLLLYQKDSCLPPHNQTDKAPGMFATINITLPSQFTGGTLRIQHGKKIGLINIASDSEFSTQVAAWYTDVTHSADPILSGYRLALSYNIIHCGTPSQKPNVEVNDVSLSEASKLRRVLQTWIEIQEPPSVVYLFDHQYSTPNLLATALEESDAYVIKNMRAVAEPLGFRIYVANIKLFRTGYGNADDDYGDEWEGTSEWTADCLVDLQGNPVDIQKLKIKNEYVIPYNLAEESPDEIEKDDDYGHYGSEVELSYHRTGLIFWPEKLDLKNVGDELEILASAHLSNSWTTKPTESETILIQGLVNRLSTRDSIPQKQNYLRLIRQASIQWKAPKIWLDAYKKANVASNLNLVGSRFLAEDLELFGLDAIGNFFDTVVENSNRTSDVFELLTQVDHIAEKNNDEELRQWVVGIRVRACRSLRSPDRELAAHLITEIIRHGHSLLVDVILPQLEKVAPSYNFWTPFLADLYDASLEGEFSPNPDTVLAAITSILERIVPNARSFPRSKISNPDIGELRMEPEIGEWIGPVVVCISTNHLHLLRQYFSSMAHSLEGLSLGMKSWIGTKFFPPAMRSVGIRYPASTTTHEIREVLTPFWQMALDCYIRETLKSEKQAALDGRLVLDALHRGANVDELRSQLLKETAPSYSRATLLRDLARDLARDPHNNPNIAIAESVREIVKELSTYVAKSIPLKSPTSSTDILEKKEIMSILDWTFSMYPMKSLQTLRLLAIVLERLLKYHTTEKTHQEYLDQCLLPTLSRLISTLKTNEITLPFDPISNFAANVIEKYVQHVVGNDGNIIVPDQLQTFGCGCYYCETLRKFFKNTDPSVSFRLLQRDRRHLEDYLRRYQVSRLGFTWTIPWTFEMYKPAEYVEKYGLTGRKKKAIQLLDTLGDRYTQKQVLADKWPAICAALGTNVDVVKPSPDQAQDPVLDNSTKPHNAAISSAATGNPNNSSAINRKRPFEVNNNISSQMPLSKRPRTSLQSPEIIQLSD